MNHFYFIILTLLLFSCTSKYQKVKPLPHIVIDMPQGVGWEEKDSCSILYISSNFDTLHLKGGIKCRGGLSSAYGKHNYSLELNDKFELCGLPKEDDWILHANYIDKTFMRHKLSYDLFRQMSVNNIAPQSTFLTVSYNGEFHGLYTAIQRVNRSLIGAKKGDTCAFLFKEPEVFYNHQNDSIVRTGNYNFQKYPKFHKANKNVLLDELNHFLFHSSAEVFIQNIDKYFDLNNLMDWHLLLLVTNNSDGIMKNFYCYGLNDGLGVRIVPWDYDHSFGRDGNGDRNDLDRNADPERAIVIKRLMSIGGDNTYVHQLEKRYKALRSSGVFSSENLTKKVKVMEKQIRPYIQSNFERWPVDGAYYIDSNDFEMELAILLDYFPKCFKMLDERFGYQP
ncbi:CotH kinase family protein [Lishizhenia sp.]|uniref:CotH kinase family protein n=1 Tax=Lishizhenia sp. TaxID=2497594 RepID=UPI00299DD126|nr:CotH kinase family protein [Lishizhenia sp.]MDX1445000.1 CotH kinase family protein [Lishizhenia sp.]